MVAPSDDEGNMTLASILSGIRPNGGKADTTYQPEMNVKSDIPVEDLMAMLPTYPEG